MNVIRLLLVCNFHSKSNRSRVWTDKIENNHQFDNTTSEYFPHTCSQRSNTIFNQTKRKIVTLSMWCVCRIYWKLKRAVFFFCFFLHMCFSAMHFAIHGIGLDCRLLRMLRKCSEWWLATAWAILLLLFCTNLTIDTKSYIIIAICWITLFIKSCIGITID